LRKDSFRTGIIMLSRRHYYPIAMRLQCYRSAKGYLSQKHLSFMSLPCLKNGRITQFQKILRLYFIEINDPVF